MISLIRKGFNIVELLIAIVLFAFLVIGIYHLFISSTRTTRDLKYDVTGFELLSEAYEWVNSLRWEDLRDDGANYSSLTLSKALPLDWQYVSDFRDDDGNLITYTQFVKSSFQRKVEFETLVSGSLLEATVYVRWREGKKWHMVFLKALIPREI